MHRVDHNAGRKLKPAPGGNPRRNLDIEMQLALRRSLMQEEIIVRTERLQLPQHLQEDGGKLRKLMLLKPEQAFHVPLGKDPAFIIEPRRVRCKRRKGAVLKAPPFR